MKFNMKYMSIVIMVSLCSCAKNSQDIVNDGRPMGVFEPKRDYVVDIPMGSTKVTGKSSGMEILGIFTIGASETAEGVDISGRGDSTLRNNSAGGAVFNPVAALGPALALIPKSSKEKFKSAALRDACENNNCDVLGYTMYNVNEKNYWLFKTYDVQVSGFPGRVESLENVNRIYRPTDSYWRSSVISPYIQNK